ncbi:MAG: amidophosphoribosyltransferase, partial [Clostridiales bacterium]|nr:amidophosphoribosyltransferase [Clostridiales bacterium]
MDHGINPDKLREECGVLGIYTKSREDTAKLLYYGLYALQHRGQESAGIAVNDGLRSNYHKGIGLVPDVFNEKNLEELIGEIGIGHVRYSSEGMGHLENAQPLVARYRRGSLSLAHNGSLINADIIRERLEDDGVIFQTSIDSEVIVNLIARYSNDGIIPAIERTMDLIKG